MTNVLVWTGGEFCLVCYTSLFFLLHHRTLMWGGNLPQYSWGKLDNLVHAACMPSQYQSKQKLEQPTWWSYLSVHCGDDMSGYFEDRFSSIDPLHICSILSNRRSEDIPNSCLFFIRPFITCLIPRNLASFTPLAFLSLTLVLLASLIAKYPGGRLQETGMLNSWDDRRLSLRSGSQEYPTKKIQEWWIRPTTTQPVA